MFFCASQEKGQDLQMDLQARLPHTLLQDTDWCGQPLRVSLSSQPWASDHQELAQLLDTLVVVYHASEEYCDTEYTMEEDVEERGESR